MDADPILNLIGGRWLPASGGEVDLQRNPADLEQVTGTFPRSSRADAAAAIAAASEAFPAWSRLTMSQRAGYVTNAIGLLRQRRDAIARIITIENGKTLAESQSEIDATIREMEWQVAEGRRLAGEIMPSDRAQVLAYSVRRPLGVVSLLLPFNFPLSVPGRKGVPALMAGNTVVIKPSSLTPRTGAAFAALFADAGLPPGVLNCLTGDGVTIGDELVRNPSIRAVSFTGSTAVGMGIQRVAAVGLVRTQLEMGGKNPTVVLADADLDAAADAVVTSAFACAGQWCTATSRVLVQTGVAAEFERLVLARIAGIRVGDGLDPRSQMGPVCGEGQMAKILAAIAHAHADGGRLACGGVRSGERGCFIAPTVFSQVLPSHRLAREEVFGPVLALIEVADDRQALEVANDVEYGLSSSIFTSSLKRAHAFIEGSEVGLTHVNLPTAHKEPQLPFGGIKHSGCGVPEAGHAGIEFFTRHQAVYIGH